MMQCENINKLDFGNAGDPDHSCVAPPSSLELRSVAFSWSIVILAEPNVHRRAMVGFRSVGTCGCSHILFLNKSNTVFPAKMDTDEKL